MRLLASSRSTLLTSYTYMAWFMLTSFLVLRLLGRRYVLRELRRVLSLS